jgi:flagellar basal body-associated protein FliL
MNDQPDSKKNKIIFVAQLLSLLLIWIFVVTITLWISNLILLSIELNDAPGASVAISIVAIPVFITLAGVLTYVFVGLHKEKHRTSTTT